MISPKVSYLPGVYKVTIEQWAMGNANNSSSSLEKGQGFRILKVAEDSPFRGKVDEFFDFIIQVIPQTIEKSPT